MKINVTSKFKIWLVITLALLVVGMAFLGIFGINKSLDLKKHYELSVSVNMDVEGSGNVIKNSTEKYIKDKGANFSKLEIIEGDISKTYVYSLKKNVEIDQDELSSLLQNDLNGSGFTSTAANVSFNETISSSVASGIGLIISALAISTVLLFVYALIFEKLASAITVAIVTVGSTILTTGIVAITRIPVASYMGLYVVVPFIITAILSLVMVNRFKEIINIVGNEKMTFVEIANKGASQSSVRFIFLLGAVIVASIFLATFGMLFEGLALLTVSIVSVLATFVWTPILWKALKEFKK